MALRYAAVLAFFTIIAAVILAQQHGVSSGQMRNAEVTSWFGGGRGSKQSAAKLTQEMSATSQPAPAETKLQRRLPATYGVFAGVGGNLYELQALQQVERPITGWQFRQQSPGRAGVLPDGHLRFIVYQRDAKSGDGLGTVDVRIIARVRPEPRSAPRASELTAPARMSGLSETSRSLSCRSHEGRP